MECSQGSITRSRADEDEIQRLNDQVLHLQLALHGAEEERDAYRKKAEAAQPVMDFFKKTSAPTRVNGSGLAWTVGHELKMFTLSLLSQQQSAQGIKLALDTLVQIFPVLGQSADGGPRDVPHVRTFQKMRQLLAPLNEAQISEAVHSSESLVLSMDGTPGYKTGM